MSKILDKDSHCMTNYQHKKGVDEMPTPPRLPLNPAHPKTKEIVEINQYLQIVCQYLASVAQKGVK